MANYVYPLAVQAMMKGDLDLETADIKIVFVDSSFAYSATDEFLSAIDAGDIIATSPALASKTFSGMTFDAADPVLSAVTGTIAAAVLYEDTGVAATSHLIAYYAVAKTMSGADMAVVLDAAGLIKQAA